MNVSNLSRIDEILMRALLLLCLSIGLLTAADAAVDQNIVKQALSLPFVEQQTETGMLQTADGELKLSSSAAADERSQDLKKLKQAVRQYQNALQDTSLSALSRDAIKDVIGRVIKTDKGLATDQVNPAFARRLVRHGWLDAIAGLDKKLKKEGEKLSRALEKASALEPVHEWQAGAQSLTLFGDAWGPSLWVYRNRDSTQVALRPAVPMYDNSIPVHKVWVQYSLDGKVDLNEPQILRSASKIRVVAGDKELAAWSEKDEFASDEKTWRSVFKRRSPLQVSNNFPPHIVQQDLDGSIYRLLVSEGELEAPQDSSEEAATAFLDQAARVMKDAGHLDLIGQYLVKYVYDSPETSVPFLVGNRDLNGDIHQTALETLSTVSGGVCRGDCDDAAELYQQIIERQGRLGHVIMLPGHAALAFAEERENQWRVIVLQTGPALEFKDKELPKALEKAYKHFGATETFDPNGLSLLLRFSNEKTRGPWRLGWRIFSDADYADTMIDIQKDWHFQTYLQAIKKMQKILEDEANHDPANMREISSLYAFTGQWDKFVEYHEKAVALTRDPVSLLEFDFDFINSLFDAGRDEAALEVLDKVMAKLGEEEMRKRLGDGIIGYGLKLASICSSNGKAKQALKVLDQTVSMSMLRVGQMLTRLIQRDVHNNEEWDTNSQIGMLRRMMRQYVATGLGALERLSVEERPKEGATIQIASEWLKKISFADIDGPTGELNNYALLAEFLSLDSNFADFMDEVEKAGLPEKVNNVNHRQIFSGDDRALKLSWIKASAPLWAQMILQSVNNRDRALDHKLVKRYDQALQEALGFVQEHQLDSRNLQISAIQAQVAAAMLDKDNKRLRELLKTVKEREDKWLRDGVAALMGNMARHIDIKDYDAMVDAWVDEVNYKPKYYWMAWRAALVNQPQHALLVAKRAATLFKDDPSFVEEYEYMQKLFK